MARVRIKRGYPLRQRGQGALRTLFGLGLLALPASCLQPLIAARASVALTGQSLMIALDPPAPFDPATDPLTLLQPVASAAVPVVDPAALAVTPLGAPVDAPFTPPDAASFSPGPAAAPYVFRGRGAVDTLRASLCLTAAIYYEAANEPDDGQRAVAQVVLNRVRHPAWPDTVCDVVYQGTERPGTLCQFTFGCDGAMARAPSLSGWIRARRVAQAALAGYVHAPVGLATHYHTLAVSPAWGKTLTPVGIIGAHIFYRLPGGAGSPRAFYALYRGNEPTPGPRAKLVSPTDPLVFALAGGADPAALSGGLTNGGGTNAIVSTPVEAPRHPVKSVAADQRYVSGALPESDIRAEYRSSGEWIGR